LNGGARILPAKEWTTPACSGKALSLVKSDSIEQKATASSPGFDLSKCAKPCQPRSLRRLTMMFVTGKEFAKWSCENKNSEPGVVAAGGRHGQTFHPRREIVVVGCWVRREWRVPQGARRFHSETIAK